MTGAARSLAALVIVAWGASTTVAPLSARQAPDDGVFAAILKDRPGTEPPFRWAVSATPLPVVRPSATDWAWFGPSTRALEEKVASGPDAAPADFHAAAFPPNVSLLTTTDVEFLREALRGPDSRNVWEAFLVQHHVRALYAFSTPVVTDDGLRALVFYALTDGVQSGRSGFFLLHRASRDAAWSVLELPKSMS
jgi:hypothetical protein